MKHIIRYAVACVLALSVGTATVAAGAGMAWAKAPKKGADRVVFKKRTVIDLTGAVIEGELTKPEGSYIVNRKLSRFSNIIQLRKDFVPELMASADMM